MIITRWPLLLGGYEIDTPSLSIKRFSTNWPHKSLLDSHHAHIAENVLKAEAFTSLMALWPCSHVATEDYCFIFLQERWHLCDASVKMIIGYDKSLHLCYYYNGQERWRVISLLKCIISFSRTQSSTLPTYMVVLTSHIGYDATLLGCKTQEISSSFLTIIIRTGWSAIWQRRNTQAK